MQVYVGIYATDTILNLPVSKDTKGMKKFKISWKAFLFDLIDQIRSRFETKSLQILSFLIPENALNRRHNSLRKVFPSLPYMKEICDCEYADLKWRQLGVDSEEVNSRKEQDAVEFWKNQLRKNKMNCQPKYPNLMKVVGCALSLLHSNGAVEQIFCQVRLIKADLRNSL